MKNGQIETISKDPTNENEELWNSIGFHRPLAGFWYHLALTILHILSASVATILLFPIMFPYPQIDGYYRAGTAVFSAIFIAFDLGTANMMSRFIGENNIKDPRKMVHYIQYFVWYQMFSGLIQVTGIAIWLLYFPPQDLAYLVWIMLLFSSTQYPAMQNVFKSALQSLQQFNKSAIIGFIQGDVIQRLTEIGFVIIFRYTLGSNAKFGIILAASIGLCLGKYLDDFIAMVIGMRYFKQIMEKYGLTVRDCFRHDFSLDLVKQCFFFGLKTGFPGVISGFTGLIILTWWLQVPQYTTFIALLGLAESLVNFIRGLKIDLGGAISESYLNGKKELCQYYIGQSWRFDGFIQILFYSLIIVVTFILEPALILVGLENYLLAIPFIFPTLIRRFFTPYEELASAIITGTNHPNVHFILELFGMIGNLINWWLILVVLRLPQNYGIDLIIWIMPMGDIIVAIMKLSLQYFIIQKRILKIKIPLYQTFIGPGITGALVVAFGYLYKIIIFPLIESILGLLFSILTMGIVFVLGMPFLYFAVTVFLGVWDDGSLDSFKKASNMSGFASVITKPLNKVL
ncbi:MAG: hypothetical protein GF364_02930, partial [Candidatus Lokiarchaeota archaeon]|nr:hypothetical protein [Candidatus Lokiarchaeota archaeon]